MKVKETQGITLIALIITIVVLMILAGVAIRSINGGIIENANKATGKYNSKVEEENNILAGYENELNKYAGENTDKFEKEPTNVEYFNWTTTETTATINGFSDEGKAKYNAGEITELIIPGEYKGLPVTTISEGCFKNCTEITEIKIPKSIVTVNITNSLWPGPFGNCSNIGKIEFEEGMEKIPSWIFYKAKLKDNVEIKIPSSVTTIGNYAFGECTGIKDMNILEGITEIGNYAFSMCTGISTLKIPSSVNIIGKYAFYQCTGINNLEISSNVTTISEGCFGNCTGITEIKVPKSIVTVNMTNSLYNGPFGNCSNICKIEFEEGMEKIPSWIFYKAKLKDNVEIKIPSSVTTIGNYAFGECNNLITVDFCGTEIQWNAISIGSNNDPLTSATKKFNQ